MLRNFYQDDHLEFDSAGSVKGKAHPGSWTIGRVGITKIKLQANRLELDGVRVADVFDIKASKFCSVRTSQRVRIVVDRDPLQPSSLDGALSRVFLTDSEKLADLVPPYWKAFAEGRVEAVRKENGSTFYQIRQVQKTESKQSAANTAQRVGATVTAPKVTYAPDPHYVPLAKAASFQGTTRLGVIVTNQGTVGEIQVLRPVGFGFDDAAAETVKTRTFKPATKNGIPVAVQIDVEVDYRLY
jgi:TonB family protein